jgi:MFS family permease
MSSVVEDTPASWGSALLQDDYGASELVAGFAYVGFQTTMTIGRFTGDRITDRFGRVAVARVGGVLIAVPLALALLTHTAAAVIAAFACAGLGAATLFPAAMHAAGSIPGIRSSDGIAVVSWLARVGFLAAPPVVGAIGDHVDLRAGVAVVVVAGLLILALAKVMAPADRDMRGTAG